MFDTLICMLHKLHIGSIAYMDFINSICLKFSMNVLEHLMKNEMDYLGEFLLTFILLSLMMEKCWFELRLNLAFKAEQFG